MCSFLLPYGLRQRSRWSSVGLLLFFATVAARAEAQTLPRVIFLKGFFSSSDSYEKSDHIGTLFRRAGFDFYYTHVPAGGNAVERAALLATELAPLLDGFKTGDRYVLLGISQGGLDARAFLHQFPKMRTHCAGVVTVGTPHQGSSLAEALSLETLELWSRSFVFSAALRALDLARRDLGFTTLEESSSGEQYSYLRELIEGASFLTRDYVQTVFNPSTPDVPGIRYWSYSTFIPEMPGAERRKAVPRLMRLTSGTMERRGEIVNDGVVGEESAHWGTHLAQFEVDHMNAFLKGTESGAKTTYREVFGRIISDLKQLF